MIEKLRSSLFQSVGAAQEKYRFDIFSLDAIIGREIMMQFEKQVQLWRWGYEGKRDFDFDKCCTDNFV